MSGMSSSVPYGKIKTIGRGTITLAGTATQTATITAVDTAKTELRHLGGSSNETTVANTMTTLELTNTTTITAGRNGSTGTTLVNYEYTERY